MYMENGDTNACEIGSVNELLSIWSVMLGS